MGLPERIAHLVVHRTRVLWLAVVVLALISGALIFWRAKLNSDVLDMLPSEFESVQIYKLQDREFGGARDLIFGLAGENGEGQLDAFADHFTAELRKAPWVSRVMQQSPFDAPGGVEELRAIGASLILNQNDEDFAGTMAALKPEVIRKRLEVIRIKMDSGFSFAEFDKTFDPLGVVKPALKGLSTVKPTSTDDPNFKVVFAHTKQPDLGEAACNEVMAQVADFKKSIAISWEQKVRAEQKNLGVPPEEMGAPVVPPQILCTGRTAYVAEMSSKLKSDINSTIFGSIFLVAVTFYTGFRRWKPLRAIVDALLFSCLLAVGCGVALFGSLNMITIGLCAILVGLGVDLAMVLYALYLDERERGHGHEQAIAAALRTHGPGIWFGAMTTAAAFLCLLFSGSPGYRQLGVLIACGILICAAVMMAFLWIFLGIRLWRWLYHLLVVQSIAAVVAGLVYVIRNLGSWDSYVWQNILVGVVSVVVAIALVVIFTKLTARIPAVVFTNPWRILGASLPLYLLLLAWAVLPIGKVAFDIDPKTLEPRPSHAGDALREIMSRLNPGGLDSVMAVIRTDNAESFSTAWRAADASWRKLTVDGAPAGTEALFKSVIGPVGLVTSPARMKANAAKLAAADLAQSKAALDAAIVANDINPAEMASAHALLDALADAGAGRFDVAAWRKSIPESSAWWFVIDNMLSRDSHLGIARLKPVHAITTVADASRVREALAVPGVKIELSGWGFTLAELKPWSNQKMVVLTAAMVGFNILILLVLLKDWRPVIIIMAGMAFSIAGMFATLKATGLTLNLFNVLAFPLVLGVGVDYSIYATLAVRSGNPRRELTALMKPLVLSGLTTAIGFVTLAWSYNPALRGLGLLCGVGVGWCLVTAFVFVLPACAWILRRQPNVPAGNTETASVSS